MNNRKNINIVKKMKVLNRKKCKKKPNVIPIEIIIRLIKEKKKCWNYIYLHIYGDVAL